MKIRTKFVANSSTTSFCIYGAKIEDRDLVNITVYEMREQFWQLQRDKKVDAHVYTSNDEYTHYIGVSYTYLKDNETGGQFKQRAKAEVEKAICELGGQLIGQLEYFMILEPESG